MHNRTLTRLRHQVDVVYLHDLLLITETFDQYLLPLCGVAENLKSNLRWERMNVYSIQYRQARRHTRFSASEKGQTIAARLLEILVVLAIHA